MQKFTTKYTVGLLWALLPAIFLILFYLNGIIAEHGKIQDPSGALFFFFITLLSSIFCPLPLALWFVVWRSHVSAVCLFTSAVLAAFCLFVLHLDPCRFVELYILPTSLSLMVRGLAESRFGCLPFYFGRFGRILSFRFASRSLSIC